ncbi:MAG: M14 family metallopeptidase [Verrucomicrobiota bacterium]
MNAFLRFLLLGCALAGALAGTSLAPAATTPGAGLPTTPIVAAPNRAWDFPADGVTFDSEFEAARLSECTRVAPLDYALLSSPENRPINPSPWFAFRVRSTKPQVLTIRVSCEGTRLRYVPKISVDGHNWIALPPEAYTPGPKPDEGTLRLDVGPEPLWVAAQEIVSVAALEAWSLALERLPFVTRSEIGRSVGNRPIHQLLIDATGPAPKSGSNQQPGLVVVLSRQHPPEVTGSQALMTFIETILADTPRAREFRAKFALLVVPLINPDGVALGHWRHNLNGVDTNRDWGVFEQPETRAVRDAIMKAREGRRQFLHLDFHSNFIDDLYTQPDDVATNPPNFTQPWVEGIERRVPTYKLKRSASRNPTPTTSHNWAHAAFGVPAITYEVGDNTERTVLRAVAAAAAESMMEQLLLAAPK